MSDMSALMGRSSGGFAPDPRYLALADNTGDTRPGGALPPPAPAFTTRPDGTASDALLALLDSAARRAIGGANRTSAQRDEAADLHEAYTRGVADGRAEAEARFAANSETGARLAGTWQRLDTTLAAEAAERLTEAVVALCEATLAPLALDPQAIADRAARAIDLLVERDAATTLRLHPDTLALVAPLLPTDLALRPDPTLARGALAVDTPEGGLIDDPTEWPRAIRAAILAHTASSPARAGHTPASEA